MLNSDYEGLSDQQKLILQNYVTNTSGNVFVLYNLPEVVKGVLFSRYSRSSLGLRSLLLKEFISEDAENSFKEICPENNTSEIQLEAIKKAQNFYDRILDGYGDDSIGELGGVHVAIENISMLAAKSIEDNRIGGSPLEKSTRYIYFDQKVNGEYLFYREPILMTSAYRDLYVDTCNHLFETYSRLIPPVTAMFEEKFPKDPDVSKVAYTAALRAKVLDCLRGLLPAGTMTNMGVYGNGRFFEQLIHKLHCENLSEMQELGKSLYDEVSKVMPSFVRRADITHHTHQAFAQFYESMHAEMRIFGAQVSEEVPSAVEGGASLIDYDKEGPAKVAAAILFASSNRSLQELLEFCKELPEEEIARILDAGCSVRENRRHKSPRALENAFFTFEVVADFGAYRDLHRHRMLTQERQLLGCHFGYDTPKELLGTDCEEPYREAMNKAKEAYLTIAAELPEEAQYVVPMAYNVRWYFNANLRALQWLTELRSSPAGHPAYRHIAQSMAKQVCQALPLFERFFKFVDYDGYEIGRLGQEIRKVEKQSL